MNLDTSEPTVLDKDRACCACQASMGPHYRLKKGIDTPLRNSRVGQETTLVWGSQGYDVRLSDERTGIGDDVEVLVDHARSALPESEGIPSRRGHL